MFLDRLIPRSPSVKRHLAKTITWRIVGTVDTMILGWIITGNAITGAKIGGLEVMTKMVLYFLHERAWFKVNYGLPHREKKNEIDTSTIVKETKPEKIE